MFGIFKKKLHSKVLVLSALPYNQATFNRLASSKQSDFIRTLSDLYQSHDIDVVWDKYKKTAKNIQCTFETLRQCGAEIITPFTVSDLKRLPDFDVVIILAHHSDSTDEIELGNGCVRTSDFVSSIPENTEAILDMTSCYSDYLIPRIKGRIPNSRIIGIDSATSLPFRLFLLEKTIKAMVSDSSLVYLEALKRTLGTLPSNSSRMNVREEKQTIHLGKKDIKSTVAAPMRACKGENFVVSVFIHKEEAKDEIELLAKSIDEEAVVRSSKKIAIKIRKGDRVDFQLFVPDNLKPFFVVDKMKRSVVWDGNTDSVEFVIAVANQDKVPDFIGRIHVYVNHEPQFDMLFKTQIVDKVTSSSLPASGHGYAGIDFVRFDKDKESLEARNMLISRLSGKRQELLDALANDGNAQELIRNELEMCNKCIELIQDDEKVRNDILKVFISSTSDMKEYRNVLRERVLSLGMFPDMYEIWGQGNDYPRDKCCKHVLASDIFVCILGHKYGFVEPLWGKSMTEIEYRIASNAGIPILIYIKDDYKQQIDQLLGEDKKAGLRQLDFIAELSTKRMVSIFPNDISLALLADSELLTVKHHLQL